MKSIGTITLAFFDSALAQRQQPQDRRFYQLMSMLLHHNPSWNFRSYTSYGCNCHYIVGDRPMSTPGYGQAIDDLDAVCKDHKSCLNCVEEEFGDQCIGELVNYNFDIEAGDGITCLNAPGTCERALCECDKKFSADHYLIKDAYNDVFNHLTTGFPFQDVCRMSFVINFAFFLPFHF